MVKRLAAVFTFQAAVVWVIVAIFTAISSEARAAGPPLGGWMQNFTPADPPLAAPDFSIRNAAGDLVPIGSFRGKVVLLNFWATWCAPCIREMPTLDRLQARLGGPRFTVVAVSEDRGGARIADPFLRKLGLRNLAIYVDEAGRALRALGATGLPTTLVIDARGRVRGRLEGPAEWDSPEAVALLRHYLDGPGARD